ncbi:MAG TPA: hypothetical protein P5026_12155, partial [Kiritimatiellia bacterium]|nr:hypothetical protein [Kiritimatiellia bacterium]
PYYPEAGFSVGTTMGRNKLIYALADYGLVVSADFKKGGTWEGAQEELRRKPGRPVFVRMTGSVRRATENWSNWARSGFRLYAHLPTRIPCSSKRPPVSRNRNRQSSCRSLTRLSHQARWLPQ